ncbi:DUF4124 domain-containing protein [Vibrio makurazakiensis]|uniref:DUF4124 domain-containing protein n=1 Tax=Vibrio makurazakiensis TaxID=2910250 RepID=UPI003D0AED60
MKHRLILIWLTLAVPALLSAQTVYTWEDENGVLHFGDTPAGTNAKPLTFADHQAQAPAPKFETSKPVETQSNKEQVLSPSKKKKPETPKALALTLEYPVHDQTIRSNQGLININLTINRKLAIGEQLQLILDGRRFGAPQTQLGWQLKNVDRGTHTISIQAHRSGKLIASTTPITVYLHRATIK